VQPGLRDGKRQSLVPPRNRAIILIMATTNISAADAGKDFDAVLARVQAGETFVIEKERRPVAVVAAPGEADFGSDRIIQADGRRPARGSDA
jgi:antitoxin (DNA-binding transcriptional repressor) of toxin-antitoxin stability system